MKKNIRVGFTGWWDSFDYTKNLMFDLLSRHYDVVVCDAMQADYVLCSLYAHELVDVPGIRIFYTAEAVVPDFNLYDYCIGFDNLTFGDRYLRIPNYIMNLKYKPDLDAVLSRASAVEPAISESFCCWVCSNSQGDTMRDRVFDLVSTYKRVDSGGLYRNNIGQQGRLPDKRAFLRQYKFSLALENTTYRNYCTEKIVEAFSCGTVPIYWGDPAVTEVFNPNAFINLMEFSTIEEGLQRIIDIDNDDSLYLKMRREPALRDSKYFDRTTRALESFLLSIIEQPFDSAFRRPDNQNTRYMRNILRMGYNAEKQKRSHFQRIKDRILSSLRK